MLRDVPELVGLLYKRNGKIMRQEKKRKRRGGEREKDRERKTGREREREALRSVCN